jgi:hypothetical protein
MSKVAPVQRQSSDIQSNQTANQTSSQPLQSGEMLQSASTDARTHAAQLRATQLLAQSSQRALQLKAIAETTKNSDAQRSLSNFAQGAVQLKKDRAVYAFDDGESGVTTATKVIDPKDGSRGLFKYAYGSGNIIDSFNGTNLANPKIANGTPYEDLKAPNIAVKVAAHDLGVDYGDDALSPNQVVHGGRPLHFAHADKAHGINRTDKYTWHHLQNVGKMELIDMNVHGAMWHYGGISGWAASIHDSDSSDDDPSE